jgi:hypothetical protein
MVLPARWGAGGLGDFAGRVRFVRRFGRPRQLDPHERAWLCFEGVTGAASFSLNAEPLGERGPDEGPVEFEVTDRLRSRNELTVEVTAADGSGGLWGEVVLEVRCPAFLRGVQLHVTADGQLHAAGEIVGSSSRPLELYLVADGATVAYSTHPAGGRVAVTAELPPGARPRQVRLELVDGGSLWYVREQPL